MLESIVNFPATLNRHKLRENDLWAQILSEQNGDHPSIEEILSALKNQPGLVENWINYSQDRRKTPSWYFSRDGNKFKVGYMPTSLERNEGIYDDAYFACALFIKLELEQHTQKQ
jgi:hypothetical protein